MTGLRITVLYQNIPFPADRGGKADVWRRLLAFKARGLTVQLIHWPPVEAVTNHGTETIAAALDDVIALVPRRRLGLVSVTDMAQVPFQITKFRLGATEYDALLARVRNFSPDAVWIEGPWTSEVGVALARDLRRPLHYRSHNIEHLYMPSQAAATRGLIARWKIRLSNLHLKSLELRSMQAAATVHDISNDDLEWWKARGVGNGRWMPPISEAALKPAGQDRCKDIDVLFLGNLQSPNNLRGVEWLLDRIWPRVRETEKDARLVVAGSGPDKAIRQRIESAPGVQLIADVPDAQALLHRAKVLVNPALTGSGIQLKTMDMLTTSSPVVATPQGVAGFPDWLKRDVAPQADVAGFSGQILRWLGESFEPSQARREAQRLFSVHAVDPVVDELQKAKSA